MPERVLVITDEAMSAHDPGPGHPERPARILAMAEMVRGFAGTDVVKPHAAKREHIARVHAPTYIDSIDELRGRSARLDPDTAVSPGSVDAAYLAAGAAIVAVEHAVETKSSAFALVRPPGHHAERDRAMGFCLFNNIAIAAAHAIEALGMQRVLIVDWDVHHGNGTQHVFEHRCDVLTFSSHQWPFYPGTGAINEIGFGDGEGFNINAPLLAGLDDASHVALYQRLLVPIAEQFAPDLVLVSAGFDSHRDDPLGGMLMTERGFAALCGIVREIADRHASGRLALILEGGYNLDALCNSVRACIDVLNGAAPPDVGPPSSAAQRVIDEIHTFHRRYWRI